MQRLILPEDKHIPPELMVEILARLPAKAVIKLRCVSKNWCSIIDSPNFISMHLKLSNNKTLLLAMEFCEEIKGWNFSIRRCDDNYSEEVEHIHQTKQSYEILGNCDGLMLVESRQIKNNKVRLWNPSLGTSLLLHPPQQCHAICFVGYDQIKNDHKVVAFNIDDLKASKVELRVGVYSVNHHLWRVNNVRNIIGPRLILGRRYVSFRGVVYWIGGGQRKPESQTHVFSFDLHFEEFSFIELPDAGKNVILRTIFVLDELSLAVLSMSNQSSCVWVMETDGENKSWRVWSEGYPNVMDSDLLMYRPTDILRVQNSDVLLLNRAGKVYSYDIRNHQIQQLGKLKCPLVSFSSYIESLLLNKGPKGETLLNKGPKGHLTPLP